MESKFLKEINYIKNNRYKENLITLINELPDYFFKVGASSTGKYHPSFANGLGGLVRHTKVAVKIAYDLLNNPTIGNVFNDDEKDLIIIGLILHDGLKHGFIEEEYVRFDHPLLVCDFIDRNKEKLTLNNKDIEFLKMIISSHMGSWNTNKYSNKVLPLPSNKYQKFVHMCDFLASKKYLDVKFDDNNDIIE